MLLLVRGWGCFFVPRAHCAADGMAALSSLRLPQRCCGTGGLNKSVVASVSIAVWLKKMKFFSTAASLVSSQTDPLLSKAYVGKANGWRSGQAVRAGPKHSADPCAATARANARSSAAPLRWALS